MSGSPWPMVRLGDVLERSEEWTEIDPERRYQQITVRLWGKGVIERDQIDGAQLNGRRLRVHAGEFIISRIDARNGACGLIPPELEGGVVTNDFPVFRPDPTRLSPNYLDWMSKTAWFVELCKAASEGTTNRVRLKEDRFLALSIPLPPLAEQRRIVARIEELAAKVEEARRLREESDSQVDQVLASTRDRLIGGSVGSDWVPLNTFVEKIENGKSPTCLPRPAEPEEWGVLKVGAVSFGTFDSNENKAVTVGYEVNEAYEVRSGDFLMSRANTMELVGACAVVDETRAHLMLSDKIFRFRFFADAAIKPKFLEQVLKAPILRKQIEAGASGTSPTMKNISKEKVLSLAVPNVSREEQDSIVRELEMVERSLREVDFYQKSTYSNMILPAILASAFNGKL